MIRSTVRVAAKRHRCDRCGRSILVGERHREAVASPQHDDLGNVGWWRLRECSHCAVSCGRPVTQPEATP